MQAGSKKAMQVGSKEAMQVGSKEAMQAGPVGAVEEGEAVRAEPVAAEDHARVAVRVKRHACRLLVEAAQNQLGRHDPPP